MIDVSELRALIKHEKQPLTDIEQIFRALVGYPNEEEIANSTRADRAGALNAACEALLGDGAFLPRAIIDIIKEALEGVPAAVRIPSTYGAAAEAINANSAPFLQRVTGE